MLHCSLRDIGSGLLSSLAAEDSRVFGPIFSSKHFIDSEESTAVYGITQFGR